ncbi:MAG: glycoside hydrolase family 3 N-terminal domain-containing protein [Anaerolineaceae bacterium]
MKKRVVSTLLTLILVFTAVPVPAQANLPQASQDPTALFNAMSPAERIGQLFLVTFEGPELTDLSPISRLISQYHVGGVVLQANRNNFSDTNTLEQTQALINSLQKTAWEKTQNQLTGFQAPYIPLFVGITQSGSGGETDQLISSLSPMPSALGIGASWSPLRSQEAGSLLGQELSDLGFNLVFAPSLDVIDGTDSISMAIAGISSFGGDPFWVGELGRAFVEGLHQGSEGKLAVIARHFPGLGGADRPIDEEVSTVQKSLEQLKQIELAPFMSVTGAAQPESRVDGLMVSNIRFQGFQGNIRATTRPVGFDSTALEQLISVEPILTWRNEGGLTVSDSLGSNAVRRSFDPTNAGFDAVNVARSAFLAGNDLLYLDNFKATADPDSFSSIVRTIGFFLQKYQEDQIFAQAVDNAVLRILTVKSRLYPEFTLDEVLPSAEGLSSIGSNKEVGFNTARDSVTLLAPSKDFLKVSLPQPPSPTEFITIFTDVRRLTQCETCNPVSYPNARDFQDALLNLYGSSGSNQILENRVSSYSFDQLQAFLDLRTEQIDPSLPENLRRSSWVIFFTQQPDEAIRSSNALKQILAERTELIRDKRVVVFNGDLPIFLDSTEISKITAYYALYGLHAPQFEVAARVLMQESQAQGSLPISLNTIGYDLTSQTAPDPNQIIPILLLSENNNQQTEEETATPEATPLGESAPLFRLGETVHIQAGAIRDMNQHLVPDGTVVRFTIRSATDQLIVAQPEATTIGGLAVIEYRIAREGILEVTASSEPANISNTLVLNTEGGLAQVVIPTATPQPTQTQTPISTATPQVIPTATGIPTIPRPSFPRMQDWLLMVLLLIMGAGTAYLIGFYWWGNGTWGLRGMLLTLIGGLLTYLLLTMGLGPLQEYMRESGAWFVVQIVFVGMFFGWIVALAWWVKDTLKRHSLTRHLE